MYHLYFLLTNYTCKFLVHVVLGRKHYFVHVVLGGDTVLVLCAKVLNTHCFGVMWWLMSQCRYWSVCLGFLYTEVLKVLSGCMVTSVSKKGSDPCCVGSTVNWMCGS